MNRSGPNESTKAPNGAKLRRNLITLVVLILVVVGLVTTLPGLHGVARRLSHVTPGWIALAAGVEVLSGIGYVIAFHQVFARVPRRTAAGVAWSEMAFQTVVPTGGAGGLALGGWMLHERGARWGWLAERSAVLFLLTSAISVFALTLFSFLLAVGVLAGPHRLLLGAAPAAVGAVVVLFALALPRLVTSAVGCHTWKHARLKTALEGLAESVRDTERLLLSRDWRIVGAVGYLAFDIVVLWIGLLAFGHPPGVAPLVLGYLIGSMANSIPIPGGVGALDGGLIGALVLYGVNATSATAAVLFYHAIELFVPLLIGGIAFLLERSHLAEPLPDVPAHAARQNSSVP